MEDSSSSVRKDSLFRFSFFLTRLRQITGDPNLLRHAAKWSPAGVPNGVARSTKEEGGN